LRTASAKNRLPTDLGEHRDRIDAEYLDWPSVRYSCTVGCSSLGLDRV
jgi:hypothetical protein